MAQSARLKKIQSKGSVMKQMRARAYDMHLEGKSNVAIQRLTGLSEGTFSRLKLAYLFNDQKTLDKVLHPEKHTAGTPLRLSKSNELLICIWENLKDAAEREFAVDV